MTSKTIQRVSVGDIVHYRVPYDLKDWECMAGTCRAAIVTSVNPGNPEFVSLRVFTVADEFLVGSVQMGDCPESWHWRDRCDSVAASQALGKVGP